MQHPQEIIGRSSVNFTGLTQNNFNLDDDDKKFIEATSKNLRLSDEKKQKLTNLITNFLIENNYDSLDYLEDEEDFRLNKTSSGKVVEFSSKISDEMKFSDFDHEIFCKDLIGRIYFYMESEEYEPEEQRYEKDFEVVEEILDGYNLDMIEKFEMFDVMKMEAESMNFDTVFDIFKPENKSKHSITINYIKDNFSSNKAMDMIIDLASNAFKDEETRHNSINKTKLSDKFYNDQTDKTIFNNLVECFDMDEDLCDEVTSKLAKRYTENKNIYQIAYEISDEYDLPSGAETSIVEHIKILDSLRDQIKNL